MRDYAKISPRFWTGDTGRWLRAKGSDHQVLAMYLMTCPLSNMIGLYYLPLPTISHETGKPISVVQQCLRDFQEGPSEPLPRGVFSLYDPDFEQIFVIEMAAYQIGEPLVKTDNRVKGIAKEWLSMRKSPFFMDFYRRYRKAYHLPTPPENGSPFEGACKPLRSQEQEQEQEKEKEQEENTTPKKPPLHKPTRKAKAVAFVTAEQIALPAPLDTPEARTAVEAWLKHKRLRGSGYKQVAFLERKLAEFTAGGPAALIAAIEHSIAQNWQGLFAPKENRNDRKHPTGAGQVYGAGTGRLGDF